MNHLSSLVFTLAFITLLTISDQGFALNEGRHSLIHDGKERHFLLRLPNKINSKDELLPLVLVLHGGGGNSANAEKMTGFTAKAKRERFVVVYPEGSGRMRDKLLTWNAGHCCGYAMKNAIDDVGFISALIKDLSIRLPIDTRKVYATGLSNGGFMSHRLALELPTQIAAIAPVISGVFGDEITPPTGTATLMINGMLDQAVPYQGGEPGGRVPSAWDGRPLKPALAQAEFWAKVNQCKAEPAKNDQALLIHWRYQCPARKSVELYLIKDNGHAWPGGKTGSRRADTPSNAINATDVIWEFFKRQN